MKILVVDDEKLFRVSLCDDLCEAGFQAYGVGSAEEAQEELTRNKYDTVLTDLRLPRQDGVALLTWIGQNHPNITVIVMTAYATVQTAVQAIKAGAYDYISKPFSSEELFLTLQRIEQYQQVLQENIKLKRQLKDQYQFHNLIGKSKAMEDIFRLIDVVAGSDSSVLISGETGTGKEMIANAIHYHSPRAKGPYVKVSCAVIAKDILESELFGHVKGAFTGAIREKKGRFEAANRGTIFLDDVDDIPLDLQVKLLRVLEEHRIEKVGGSKQLDIDIRVLAATKVDLRKLAEEEKFRQDLYYRLNVVPINIPPLCERQEDIPLLIHHFLKVFAPNKPLQFTPGAMNLLIDYPWPGNVRELKNMMERLVLISETEVITESQLPEEVLIPQMRTYESGSNTSLEKTLETMEINILKTTLSRTDGNQTKTAELLKIPLSTLRSKLKKYRLI